MAIRQDEPAWAALADALADLVRETGAVNAVVADSAENLWCRAIEMNTYDTLRVDPMWASAIASATAPLSQGGVVLFTQNSEPYMHAVSYAGVYLLIIWFRRRFDDRSVREIVARRLPEIERLTLALPPDDPDRPAMAARSQR